MLSIFQAIIFGLIQGITELFPISSLGHSVILPGLLGWSIDQNNPYFLTFLVATHAATSLVLFGFFWKDWVRIIRGFFNSFKNRSLDEPDARLAWLLIAGTIPAGLLGVLFEDQLKVLFASPRIVAPVLIVNGLMLLGAEWLRRRASGRTKIGQASIPDGTSQDDTVMAGGASPQVGVSPTDGASPTDTDNQIAAHLSWKNVFEVGVMQCLALVPGFSRTGSTITGGLFAGLSHEEAARFSFLLATPIIAAAAFLKLPELALSGAQAVLIPTLLGALAAGVAAYLSVRFLERYFKTETLTPFGIYCMVIGAGATLLFLLR